MPYYPHYLPALVHAINFGAIASRYFNLFEQVSLGFARGGGGSGGVEGAHSSLLVLGVMLRHTGGFMLPRFREACDAVMRLKVCRLLSALPHRSPRQRRGRGESRMRRVRSARI